MQTASMSTSSSVILFLSFSCARLYLMVMLVIICLLCSFSSFNADFDGDEINVHFPQDEISRAEAHNIVNANNQYIVPTRGDPKRALIQVIMILISIEGRYPLFRAIFLFNNLCFLQCLYFCIGSHCRCCTSHEEGYFFYL